MASFHGFYRDHCLAYSATRCRYTGLVFCGNNTECER